MHKDRLQAVVNGNEMSFASKGQDKIRIMSRFMRGDAGDHVDGLGNPSVAEQRFRFDHACNNDEIMEGIKSGSVEIGLLSEPLDEQIQQQITDGIVLRVNEPIDITPRRSRRDISLACPSGRVSSGAVVITRGEQPTA